MVHTPITTPRGSGQHGEPGDGESPSTFPSRGVSAQVTPEKSGVLPTVILNPRSPIRPPLGELTPNRYRRSDSVVSDVGSAVSVVVLTGEFRLSSEIANRFLDGGFSRSNHFHREVLQDFLKSGGKPNSFFDSSGSSCVLLDSEHAYQYYYTPKAFEKAVSFPKDVPGFVRVVSIKPPQKLIVWQRITPIKNILDTIKTANKLQVLLEQAKQALRTLHELGYVHGDSTLDNLGVDSDGNACWFDFDMSKRTDEPKARFKDFSDFERSIGSV